MSVYVVHLEPSVQSKRWPRLSEKCNGFLKASITAYSNVLDFWLGEWAGSKVSTRRDFSGFATNQEHLYIGTGFILHADMFESTVVRMRNKHVPVWTLVRRN